MTQPYDPDQPNSPSPSSVPQGNPGHDPELSALQSEMVQLQAQGENGASWFYWVAALSLVNSAIALAGGNVAFVVGLAITGEIERQAWMLAQRQPELASVANIGAFVAAVVIAGIVAGFGWLSNKRIIPVFALGILLYALDGVLFVLTEDWLCVAFHAFALYNMVQGLIAYRKLSAILRTSPAVA